MKNTPGNYRTETAGTLAIHSLLHGWGWIWRPTPPPDTGIDGKAEVVDAPAVATGRELAIQSKSGRSYIRNESDTTFEFVANPDDIAYWKGHSLPVILAVYDPTLKKLYGISIKDYLRDKPEALQKPHRIVFHKDSDLLAGDEARAWLRRLAHAGDRSYTTRSSQVVTETLHTNLLAVLSSPTTVFRARVLESKADLPRGFPRIEREGHIWSFEDPSDATSALRSLVDAGAVDGFSVKELLADKNRNKYVSELLYQVVRHNLRGLPIGFDRAHRRHYFLPDKGGPRSWSYDSVKKRATRKVAHPLSGKHWAHLAAHLTWERFGDRWFLKVVPAYVFTDGGDAVQADEDIIRLNVKKRRREYNRQVFQHLIFWREVLARGSNHIALATGGEPVLIDKHYVSYQVGFGVPDDRASIAAIAAPVDEEVLHEDDFEEDGGEEYLEGATE